MIVKTKKYQLPKNTYIKVGLANILKKQWWVFLIAIALLIPAFIFPEYKWWFIITVPILLGLYILFWAIQFTGVTQMQQNQVMFEKLSYEIDSRQILIKLNPKQGSPIPWSMIKDAKKGKDHFLFVINKGQFIYLPFKVFNSDHDLKFTETILKRKGYIKE